MGVINNLGLVGIIENTSQDIPLLLVFWMSNRINAKKKKSNHFGSLIWNGKSTGFVQLIDVPRLALSEKEILLWPVCNQKFSRKHKHWTIEKYTLTIKPIITL
jgi:rod shape-determining protein MreC